MSANIPSKSDIIRQLHKDGKSISEISKTLNIRYQHAYNVISKHNNQGGQTQPIIKIAPEINELKAILKSTKSGRKNVGTGMFSRIN